MGLCIIMRQELLAMLKISDRLIVCGQAMSHCVNFTLRDILKHWDGDRARLMLLQNGTCICVGACVSLGCAWDRVCAREAKESLS